MRWEVRAALGVAKSFVPFQTGLRRLKHRCLGYEEEPGRVDWTIEEGLVQIEWLRTAGFRFDESAVLELGTGWQPLIPLLYYLAGCRTIYLVDLVPLLEVEQLLSAVRLLRRKTHMLADRLGIPPAEVADRLTLDESHSLTTCLEQLRMRYLAPQDARRLPLKDGALDLVFSRAVLEHIPSTVVEQIMQEAGRVLKPSGVMLHFIDPSDHWSFSDNSISRVNFLKFSDATWRLACLHPQDYQNRLRHSEYVSIVTAAGFDVARADTKTDQRSLREVSSMKLAPRFRGMTREDLAVTNSRILAKKMVRAASRGSEVAKVMT